MCAAESPGWPIRRIEEVVEVNPRIDKKSIPDDLPVTFVPMSAVGAGTGIIQMEQSRFASEVKKGYTVFRSGDVLFAKITPCMENGKMAVAPPVINGYGFGSTEFHVLRPKSEIDAKYLYFFVSSQSFRKEAERHMTGAVGQRRVPTMYLKECEIPVPSVGQQKRIVAEIEKQFSRLDEGIDNLKRVQANLKRYKAAVLKAAVEGRLVEAEAEIARKRSPSPLGGEGRGEGETYETGEQLLQRILQERRRRWEEAELAKMQAKGKTPKNDKWKQKYKEPAAPDTTNLPELPEGWVWAAVGQLGSVKGGKRLPAGHKYAEQVTPYPYIRVKDFSDYTINTSNLKYLEKGTQEKIARYTISSDDVYISIAGSIGLVGRVPKKISGANLTENAAKISELFHIDKMYMVYWLSSPSGVEHISGSTIATTQAKLALFRIERIPVPLPPLSEQHRIVTEVDRRLSILRETQAQVEANLQRAERLRQSILAAAFSGRLVSCDSNETEGQQVSDIDATMASAS